MTKKKEDNIISDWGEKASGFYSGDSAVDFSKAKKLTTTGSTCDAYETRYHSRHVFIKRLKERYRFNDRYLQALKKEYEIGISLNHPSLPQYTEFFREYIVLNFVDGKTLAEIMSSDDSRLTDRNFILKIMNQLLDVIEYLHQHNVIHSDLKSDNIVIKSGTNNVILLDFDKCYTDSHDLTTGSSELYGLQEGEKGIPDIDFRGLGIIAGKLSGILEDKGLRKILKSFSEKCKENNVSITHLRKILDYGARTNSYYSISKIWPVIIFGSIVILLLIIVYADGFQNNNFDQEPVVPIETPQIIEDTSKKEEGSENKKIEELPQNNVHKPELPRNFPSDNEINEELTKLFATLEKQIDEAEAFLNDPKVSLKEKRDTFFVINALQSKTIQKTYSYFESKYPEVNPVKIQIEVTGSNVFQKILHKMTDLSYILLKQSEEETAINDESPE